MALQCRLFCRATLLRAKYQLNHRSVSIPLSTQVQLDNAAIGTSQRKTIVIPKRKKRDATSILQALASTVQKDFNSPDYVFLDDPYLTPLTNNEKRYCLLAKESGRDAADYAIQQYERAFKKDPAEPTIAPFNAVLINAEDTVEGLIERISKRNVQLSLKCWQTLKESDIAVPVSVQEDFLDLLCAYNSKDTSEVEEKQRDTWEKEGAAEKLYSELPEKSARTYNSMIHGRAKFGYSDLADELYKEAKEKGIAIELSTYNELIKGSRFLANNYAGRYDIAKGYMSDMVDAGIQPTAATFNATLAVIMNCRRFEGAREWVMEILNEMKHLDIEPTLTTWYRVIEIFYTYDTPNCNTLIEILQHIKGTHFTYHEPDDLKFFVQAMRIAVRLQDLELAYSIDALLNTGNNVTLMGRQNSAAYYSLLLETVCIFEPIEKVMELYNRITPYTYYPNFTAIQHLIEAVELNEGYHYIPQIWSDMVISDTYRAADIMESLLSIMSNVKDKTLLSTFADIVGSYQKMLTNEIEFLLEKSNTQRIFFRMCTGEVIGHMIDVNLIAGREPEAWSSMELFLEHSDMIEKYPSEKTLSRLVEIAINDKDESRVVKCIKVMSMCAYSKTEKFIRIAKERMDLDDSTIESLEANL